MRHINRAVAPVPESRAIFVGTIISVVRAEVSARTGAKALALAEIARLLQISSGLNVHELEHQVCRAPLRGGPRCSAIVDDPKNSAPLR